MGSIVAMPVANHAPGDDFDMAAEAFLADRQARGLSPFTVDFYRENLWDFREFITPNGRTLSPREVTLDLLREFTKTLQQREHKGQPVRPRTINTKLASVRALFNWLYEEEYLESNPCARLKLVRGQAPQVEALSDAEVGRLLAVVAKPKTFEEHRDRAMVMLLLDTGIRLREMLSLTVESIDWQEGMISLPHTKNRKARVVPFGSACRQSLWRYLQRRDGRAASQALLINRSGEALDHTTIKHRMLRLGHAAGLKTLGCHKLRHTFATQFLRGGGDPYSLQRLLGHQTMEMTRRYLTLNPTDLKLSHRKASPLDRLAR